MIDEYLVKSQITNHESRMMTSRVHLHFQPLDAALLRMTIIRGSNFTLVKLAVRDIPELPFNIP